MYSFAMRGTSAAVRAPLDPVRANSAPLASTLPARECPRASPGPPPPPEGRRRSRVRRWLALATLVALLGSIPFVRYVPWGGPAIANGLRSLIGDRIVTWLEERWAAAEDVWMRWTHLRMPPRRLGDASPASAPLPPPPPEPRELSGRAPAPAAAEGAGGTDAAFPPPPASPPFAKVAAVDDGVWYPVLDPERPAAPPFAYRTLVHPDPERSFAELFIVALPAREIALHLVAGTIEPASSHPELARPEPRGLIAEQHEPALLAAFNGGFQARHGHHGMIVGGVELVPLRPGLCTAIGTEAGPLRIVSWQPKDVVEPGAWYRQTPPCMLERGVLHPGLVDPASRKWGSTLEGETVIRRSALALDRSGENVYVGVSNATTARALALGMQSAGAWTVAQLDVNWSYPRFLIFPRDSSGVRHASTLFKGFLFEPEEMLRRPSPRDFFYVTRRSRSEQK